MIEFTELLINYCHQKVFPSKHFNDLVVSRLLSTGIARWLIPESETPELDINDSDTEVHSGRSNLIPKYRSKEQRQLHTMLSGKIFKNEPRDSHS